MDEKDLMFYITLTAFFMPLLLSGILAYFIIAFQKRKFLLLQAKSGAIIRENQVQLEKQAELQAERSRIAAEMHDDLGSGLTSINYLIWKLSEMTVNEEQKVISEQIYAKTKTLVTNMSEIIWAMNDRYDYLQNIIDYLKRTVTEMCEDRSMPFTFFSEFIDQNKHINGEKRRNILLIVKETINNSLKYSHATSIKVVAHYEVDQHLRIEIIEYAGIGFDAELKTNLGNGLFNINKRLKSLLGDVTYHKSQDSMNIVFNIPL
jgi:signal transduction histidine kinase